MVSFIREERRYASGCVRSIVVGELCERKDVGPVILLVVAEYAEVLFKSLVDAFSLTITFWMITGGEVEGHVQCGT